MEHLAYITLLIESKNIDDFETKTEDAFDDMTWSQLDKLIDPSYVIRGTIEKTPIHFEADASQKKKVNLTKNAYQEHISQLKKYDM